MNTCKCGNSNRKNMIHGSDRCWDGIEVGMTVDVRIDGKAMQGATGVVVKRSESRGTLVRFATGERWIACSRLIREAPKSGASVAIIEENGKPVDIIIGAAAVKRTALANASAPAGPGVGQVPSADQSKGVRS